MTDTASELAGLVNADRAANVWLILGSIETPGW